MCSRCPYQADGAKSHNAQGCMTACLFVCLCFPLLFGVRRPDRLISPYEISKQCVTRCSFTLWPRLPLISENGLNAEAQLKKQRRSSLSLTLRCLSRWTDEDDGDDDMERCLTYSEFVLEGLYNGAALKATPARAKHETTSDATTQQAQ